MSWPFSYSYIQNQPLQTTLHAFQNQIFLHSLGRNALLQALSAQIFNLPAQCGLFSSPLNQSQSNNNFAFDSLRKICPQEQNPQGTVIQLKKQQNLSSNLEQSKSAQKSFESPRMAGFRFRRYQTMKKQRNLISHNSSLRNDTKNIPKNYGKAMLSYIQKNSRQVKEILAKFHVDFLQFMIYVKSFKSKINTMHDLRQMWGQNENKDKLKKCIRILSYHFMRKKCLPYIFNSRIKNFHTHIKYRKKIMEGIRDPQNFTKIKEF